MRGFTTMNIVATLVKILAAVLLHVSSVTAASINKEVVDKSKNEVIQFKEVYQKSQCKPREVLVEILQEYPEDTEHIYTPSCVAINRCGGCCNDETQECLPSETRNVTLQVSRLRPMVSQHTVHLTFTEHKKCECRQKPELKPDVPLKKE